MTDVSEVVSKHECLVTSYIVGTHGSLPNIDYQKVGLLLSEDFTYTNEEQRQNKAQLLGVTFPGWSAIVLGSSAVRIHSVCTNGKSSVVLAHWETDYDCKDGSVWYGTNVDISGKQIRGFQVFASFTINSDNQIVKIVQRSDTVVKSLGVEKEVLEYRRLNAPN